VGVPAFSSGGTFFLQWETALPLADTLTQLLDPKTLQVKDWFSSPGASFSSTLVIFKYKDHEVVAPATKDGRVFLLDTASLGTDHKTSLYESAPSAAKNSSPAGLATWEDSAQIRSLLVPISGAKGNLIAFEVSGDGAKPSLQEGWASGEDGFSRGADRCERRSLRSLYRRMSSDHWLCICLGPDSEVRTSGPLRVRWRNRQETVEPREIDHVFCRFGWPLGL
jgi:hypothetical protein